MNFLMKFLICTVISAAILSAIAHFTPNFTLFRVYTLLYILVTGVIARLKVARPAASQIFFFMVVNVLMVGVFASLVGFNII